MVFEKNNLTEFPYCASDSPTHHLGVTWDDHRTRGLDSGISWSKVGTFETRFRCLKILQEKKHIRKA